MSEKLVRIKKLKTGEHMMVTPAYAARAKMLKNSGWVVEDLPEANQYDPTPIMTSELLKMKEEGEILVSYTKPTEYLNEPLAEKEIDLNLGDQSEEIDLLEVKLAPEATKPRGRQKGSKNK